MKLSLLLTGSELMIGSTIDSNSTFIAQQLQEVALHPFKKITVGDDIDDLVESLHYLSMQSDIILMNGGLGPTADDLTAEAISKAFHLKIEQNQEALTHLEIRFKKGTTKRNASNLKQALLPETAQIIPNPIGSAVGFIVKYKNCTIICTPGVPSEMKPMFKNYIFELIQQRMSCPQHKMRLIRTFGYGESSLQERINQANIMEKSNVILGFRAHFPYVDVKLTASKQEHFLELDQIYDKLNDLLLAYRVSDQEFNLCEVLQDILLEKKATLSCAESCTGGLIASLITQVPGSSKYFQSSFVVYSNSMKMKLLDVKKETLEIHGAVSKQTVYEMSQNLLKITDSDYVISISGIAGPDGGSEEKPLGLVWIAIGDKKTIICKCFQFFGNRLNIQNYSAHVALDLLRRYILGIDTNISYFNFKTLF